MRKQSWRGWHSGHEFDFDKQSSSPEQHRLTRVALLSNLSKCACKYTSKIINHVYHCVLNKQASVAKIDRGLHLHVNMYCQNIFRSFSKSR